MIQEPRDKRALFKDSRDEQDKVEVRVAQRTWSAQLEVDGAPIPWNASVREYQRGRARYIAEALEQPMLLPRDMDAYKRFL